MLSFYGWQLRPVVTCIPTVTETVEAGILTGGWAGDTWIIGERRFCRRSRRLIHYKYNGSPWRDLNPRLRRESLLVLARRVLTFGSIRCESVLKVYDVVGSSLEKLNPLRYVEHRFLVILSAIEAYKPRFALLTLSLDYVVHTYGLQSQVLRDVLILIDELFPMLVKLLNRIYGDYLLVTMTDHGSAPVARHLDINTLLAEHGFNTTRLDTTLPLNRTVNAVAVSNGRRFATVYIRTPGGDWNKPTTYSILRSYPLRGRRVNVVKLLAEEEAVEFVAVRGDDNRTVHILSKQGEAVVKISEDGYVKYTVVRGEDPLQVTRDKPQSTTMVMHLDKWVDHTLHTKYPGALPQIAKLFKSPHMGDLLLHPSSGWDFWDEIDRPEQLQASHGGFTRSETLVFALARRPGKPVYSFRQITKLYNVMRTCIEREC